jgi:hypothetical protein
MSTTTPAALAHPLEKHLTTLVNCLQNVIYFIMLANYVETGMLFACFASRVVSPVESWKGLFYNMWFGVLVFGMMLAFKDTLQALLLFENAKRNKDGKNDAMTTIIVDKDGAQIQHNDNGSNNTQWHRVACFMLDAFKNKDDKKSEEISIDTKPAASTDDEIKPDTASASSSARSSADTSEIRD